MTKMQYLISMPIVAIVGAAGLVGKELQRLLKNREFPIGELRLFSSKDSAPNFRGVDIAFFCVAGEIARSLIPNALEEGALCIDSSSAFRMDPDVPLVIPEINPLAILDQQGIIASPNCTTTLMLLATHSLEQLCPIERIVCSSYQSLSGAGARALESPHQRAFLHESPQNEQGYNEEEEKMHWESRKILGNNSLIVSATCVRVPVPRVHSLSLYCTFKQEIDIAKAEELLKNAPGLAWATPEITTDDASGKEQVFCGRLRRPRHDPKSLELWVIGDQLLKGAALNSVQIAEECLK
jgi:aspartate-semialdehyde dehydrogenase